MNKRRKARWEVIFNNRRDILELLDGCVGIQGVNPPEML